MRSLLALTIGLLLVFAPSAHAAWDHSSVTDTYSVTPEPGIFCMVQPTTGTHLRIDAWDHTKKTEKTGSVDQSFDLYEGHKRGDFTTTTGPSGVIWVGHGYDVFYKHCLPLIAELPDAVRALFKGYYGVN